jgi:hypothetical protein
MKGDGGADFYRFSAWVRVKFNDVNTGHVIRVANLNVRTRPMTSHSRGSGI